MRIKAIAGIKIKARREKTGRDKLDRPREDRLYVSRKRAENAHDKLQEYAAGAA